MPDSSVHTSEQMIQYIETSEESDNIDAKGPMTWDGAEESAGLAKDIAAFANSRDGGVLVIGKHERSPGQFDLNGVSEDQARSFETTKVATWINNRFAPAVRLVCQRVEHEGSTFIVILVSEFEDIPILCTKSYQYPDSKKQILREGTIYVRTANAESAPLRSVEELRSLIGLATTKRADQMLQLFDAMLKGRPLTAQTTDAEEFARELKEVLSSLDADLRLDVDAGYWQLVFHPSGYNADRWPGVEEQETLIREHAVRILSEFPGCRKGTVPREWGISNDIYGPQWGFTRSGLLVHRVAFFENERSFPNPWRTVGGQPDPDIPAGEWIDFKTNVLAMIESFMFMKRMVHEYDTDESLEYEILAAPIAGRALVSMDPLVDVGRGARDPCRANRFHRGRSVPVGEFLAGWEDECARAMKQFFDLFPEVRISHEILMKWVEKFKDRKF